jgi:hypothetical protein
LLAAVIGGIKYGPPWLQVWGFRTPEPAAIATPPSAQAHIAECDALFRERKDALAREDAKAKTGAHDWDVFPGDRYSESIQATLVAKGCIKPR